MSETSYREILAEFQARREAGESRSVAGPKHGSGRSFTTPQMIADERANINEVLQGRNALEPIMTADKPAIR